MDYYDPNYHLSFPCITSYYDESDFKPRRSKKKVEKWWIGLILLFVLIIAILIFIILSNQRRFKFRIKRTQACVKDDLTDSEC
jgi:hypothetical protein